MSLVSVIVPVYNVEEFLPRCLDSLCRQSLSDIEILLIDDASSDRCGEICDVYTRKDIRFRVFHNITNQGLSVVRNIGIDKACSEYLMFVDSDDWVHDDFCKDAYECAVRYQADLVIFRRQFIKKVDNYNDIHNNVKADNFTQSGYKSWSEAIDLLLNGVAGNSVWNKLYRKALFDDIFYPKGFLCEDIGTTYKTICHASRIYFLDKILYYYCFREGSISTQKTEKLLRDCCSMSIQQYRHLKAWGYTSNKLDEVMNNVALSYCINKESDVSDENYVFCVNMLSSCDICLEYFSYKRKVLFLLFKYCRPLFELICTLFHKKRC